MRLIDADRLEKLVSKHRSSYCHKEDVIAGIAKQPTVDAVEVVRCIDCKHFHTETVEVETPYGFTDDKKVYGCMLRGEWVDVFIDDFCSYGERKEK